MVLFSQMCTRGEHIPPAVVLTSLLAVILVVCVLAPQATRAQAQDTTDAVLPDIAPREVEIRGQLEIAFPSLQRQPLIGFNPPPRIPEVPTDRRPFTEDYKQESADLPPSPLQPPEPPSTSSLSTYPPITGEVEASGGRYADRAFFGRTNVQLSPSASVLAKVDYHGTNGHDPFDASDVDASADALEAAVGLQTTRSRLAVGATADGFFETYRLFGAEPITQPSPSAEKPERDGRGVGGEVWLRTQGNTSVSAEARLRASTTNIETQALDASTNPNPALDENRFALDATLDVPLSAANLIVDGTYSTASVNGERYDGSTYVVDGGGGIRFDYDEAIVLTLGARMLAFSDDTGQQSSETVRAGYLSPDVRVDWYAHEHVHLYAQNRPHVASNTLPDLFRTNPYLVPRPVIQPTLHTVDAEVGGLFFTGPVQIKARAGLQDSPHYLFFEHASRSEFTGYTRGFSTAEYDDARIVHLGLDLSAALPAGFHAAVGFSVRDGELTNDDTPIPYFADVVSEATLSYSFDESRGLIQLSSHLEGSRYRDRAQTMKLDPYIDLDVAASYNLSSTFGVLARIENVATAYVEQWDHYPQAPLTLTAGLRLLW